MLRWRDARWMWRRRMRGKEGVSVAQLAISQAGFLRALVVTAIVLIVATVLGTSLGGMAFLTLALWAIGIGVIGAGALLIARGRALAGGGAIACAVATEIAFYWLGDGSPLVWSVLFIGGAIAVALGTRQDTADPRLWPIVIVRIAIGWAMVDNGQDHFRSAWIPAVQGTGFFGVANGAAARADLWFGDSLYKSFLRDAVVPAATEWAALTVAGETVFGLLFAIGLFTPVAGIGLAFLHLNYIFMKGFVPHGAYTDKVFGSIEIFGAIARIGNVMGLDAAMARLLPRIVTQNLLGAESASTA
jgi:uncharacterized membrane protein YphA (DoxX/SURF4 family)